MQKDNEIEKEMHTLMFMVHKRPVHAPLAVRALIQAVRFTHRYGLTNLNELFFAFLMFRLDSDYARGRIYSIDLTQQGEYDNIKR